MSEKPILFSGPLVRAILEGRKTQTRRVMKPQPEMCREYCEWQWISAKCQAAVSLGQARSLGPYGKPGDTLWVRETWAPADLWSDGYERDEPIAIRFRADGKAYTYAGRRNFAELDTYAWSQPKKWKPSIFMPKWASRIDLLITGIRVERVQDITEADSVAEGIRTRTVGGGTDYPWCGAAGEAFDTAPRAFASLWDSINDKREGCSWDANPWVWVVEFEVVNT